MPASSASISSALRDALHRSSDKDNPVRFSTAIFPEEEKALIYCCRIKILRQDKKTGPIPFVGVRPFFADICVPEWPRQNNRQRLPVVKNFDKSTLLPTAKDMPDEPKTVAERRPRENLRPANYLIISSLAKAKNVYRIGQSPVQD